MKKYKKVFVLLLSVLMVFSVACSPNASAITSENISSVDDPQPVITETSEKPSVVEPVSEEPVSEPEPQVDPNEELTWQYLEVDEAWLKALDGVGGMGLKRNGKLYGLTWGAPVENWKVTGLGLRDGKDGTIVCFADKTDEWIIDDDRFVIPCVKGDDDLAWYGKSVGSIKLIPMSFYGYTVPVLQDTDKCETLTVFDNGKNELDSYDDLTMIYEYRNKSGMLKDVRLLDASGSDVFLDFRNLVQGDSYTLIWNDGTEHEEKLDAHWCYYKPTGGKAITLAGTATDDPLVTQYDFSIVPSGLYFIVESSGIVEVKND